MLSPIIFLTGRNEMRLSDSKMGRKYGLKENSDSLSRLRFLIKRLLSIVTEEGFDNATCSLSSLLTAQNESKKEHFHAENCGRLMDYDGP